MYFRFFHFKYKVAVLYRNQDKTKLNIKKNLKKLYVYKQIDPLNNSKQKDVLNCWLLSKIDN